MPVGLDVPIYSKPYKGRVPYDVETFMQIMDSLAVEVNHEWKFVGGFARDYLLGYEPNDFDVASQYVGAYRDKLNEMGILEYGVQERPRQKPHDKFFNPYDFSRKAYEVHWIEADCPQAYAPTRFDFTINHFSMGSDLQIYGPDYAWRDLTAKHIRLSEEIASRSTNIVLRGVRFAAKYGFSFEPKTREQIKERIHSAKEGDTPMGDDLILMNYKKMVQDGVDQKALTILHDLEFPHAGRYDNLQDLMKFHNDKILAGEAEAEPQHMFVEYED